MKKIAYFVMIFAILLSQTTTALAISEKDLDLYEANNILFYDPDDSTDCDSSETSTGGNPEDDSGSTYRESFEFLSNNKLAKNIFKKFKELGLDDVHSAAIIGNWKVEGMSIKYTAIYKCLGDMLCGGYGLAQWGGDRTSGSPADGDGRDGGLYRYAVSKGEKGLEASWETQVEYAWAEMTKEGPAKDFAEKRSNFDLVKWKEMKTIKDSTEYFRINYEAGAGSEARIDAANAAYALFSGLGCSGGVTVGGVQSVEEAIEIMKKYASLAAEGSQKRPVISDFRGAKQIGFSVGHSRSAVYGKSRKAADSGQCVHFSLYFTEEYSTLKYPATHDANGVNIVDGLEEAGASTGWSPKPNAVFSAGAKYGSTNSNHTGVVLGVLNDGTIIVGEQNWGNGEIIVSTYHGNPYGKVKYAYLDDKLKEI